MVGTFPTWMFWLAILDYLSGCSIYFENFQVDQAKIFLPLIYILTQNFENFG